mmetsp:Transcript_6094/g.9505  ORF Transcript_6094/g.9505 Transcript_6094/m.9505 type:complete len:171 (-) Transcript_6094:3-515(-)
MSKSNKQHHINNNRMINGIAHIILTVNNMKRSRAFYAPLLSFLGLHCVIDNEEWMYYVGGRTAIGICPCDEKAKWVQRHVGLHHFCFRAYSKKVVDDLYRLIKQGKVPHARIVHEPEEGNWAPGYYSLLFEDPDGIRIELNWVPGKGLLKNVEKGGKPVKPGAGLPSASL